MASIAASRIASGKVEEVKAGPSVIYRRYRYTALVIILGIFLGLIGFLLLFPTPDENIETALFMATAFLMFSGIVIGYLASSKWWLVGVVAWGGPMLVAASIIFRQVSTSLTGMLCIVSVSTVFLGGYIGSSLRHKLQREAVSDSN